MYSKIQAMKSEGFSQRQVARTLEIYRNTVREYWDMNPDEYHDIILEPAKKSSLEQHKELILFWLRTYSGITSAQIHDWLKEKYSLQLAENSVRRYVRAGGFAKASFSASLDIHDFPHSCHYLLVPFFRVWFPNQNVLGNELFSFLNDHFCGFFVTIYADFIMAINR